MNGFVPVPNGHIDCGIETKAETEQSQEPTEPRTQPSTECGDRNRLSREPARLGVVATFEGLGF